VEFKILGPFEVCSDSGGEVRLPGGRERTLLAVMVLRRGEVVSVDAIVDVLWGEHPPTTAAKAVQGYVSHLRRLLEPSGADGMLVTQAPGYVLRVPDGQLDARRFEMLAARGWRSLDEDPAAALSTFEDALALWRGPPLDEFAFSEFAQREIQRLEELRLGAVEGRIEALLRLGRHGAVVAELQTRVDEHPLRERLRGQLMLALYRGGRQAEALEAYQQGRRLLRDELGLEPGTELQRLERAILAQDAVLEPPEQRAPGGVPPMSGEQAPSTLGPRSRRSRPLVLGLVLAVVAVSAFVVAYPLISDDSAATHLAVVPPALVAVDPATNRVVASIPVGSKPVSVTAGGGAVWVGDAHDGTITKVDARLMTTVRTIGIGAPIVDLAFGVGGVWAATGSFGEVVRVDPGLGAIADRIALGDPDDPVEPSAASIGVGDGRVWVGALDGLARVSPSAGRVVGTVDLGSSYALQVAVGGGAVWATTIASRAKRIEASSGQETTEFYAGSDVYAVALGGGALWVGGVTGQIWKVDPVTGGPILGSRVIGGIAGVAFGLDAVWATSVRKPQLVRLDPATGDVEARIPVGGPAWDVVVAGGLVWVPVGSSL
jgi:DNA-binding SARP family transcriptional activator